MSTQFLNAANTKEVKTFHKLYDTAVKNNKDKFVFKGQEILTAYAKYMLMYIKNIHKE